MEMPAERWLDSWTFVFALDWGRGGCPSWFCFMESETAPFGISLPGGPPAFPVVALDQRATAGAAVPRAYRLDDYGGRPGGGGRAPGSPEPDPHGALQGALHATAFAARHPGRVAALVHVDIEPCPPPWNKKYLTGLYRDLPESYESVDAFVSRRMENSAHADRARLLALSPHNLREENGRYYALSDREVYAHFDPDYDLRPQLPGISCPVLVVRGEDTWSCPGAGGGDAPERAPGGPGGDPRAAHPFTRTTPRRSGRRCSASWRIRA